MSQLEAAPVNTRSYSLRRIFAVGFAVVMLLGSHAAAQEGYDVDEVHFSGNVNLSDNELAERMTLQGANFFQRLFNTKERTQYYSETLNSDLEKLVRYYQRQGFLYATATLADLKVNDKDHQVSIHIAIKEGVPFLLREIKVVLSKQVQNRRDSLSVIVASLKDAMKLVPGTRFRDDDIENARSVAAHRLYDLGYPYATVTPRLNVDTAARQVDVTWEVDPGLYCVFGRITITGNERIAERYIRNQLAFTTGEQYRHRALERSQQQIYGLGTFDVVTVNARLPQPRDTAIDVTVRVSESPMLGTRLGLGYGREDKFRVFSESRILSFFGGVRRFDIYAKHSGLEPYHFELRFTRPAFLTPRTTGVLAPFARKQTEPGFTVKRIGGNATLQHQVSRKLNVTGTYTIERVSLDTSSISEADTANVNLDQLYNRSSILTGLNFDNSQPPFSPDRGYYAALTFKLTGVIFKSDYKYTKTVIDLRRYTGWQGMVFATRAKLGGIAATTGEGFIPVEDRLYSGGGSSVRGWARSELGPIDPNGIPIGGNSLLEFSVEWRYPILGRFSGVMFSDFGNVWRGSYSYRLNDLRYSAGFGFRFEFPIGPARVDFARPIFDEVTTWQFHLSVGQAF